LRIANCWGRAIGGCAGSATSIVYLWTPGDSARTGFSFQFGGEGDRDAVCRVSYNQD